MVLIDEGATHQANVLLTPHCVPCMQLPPGTGVEAPFVAIAKALHKTYEEKVATYVDASRNWA